MTRENKKAYEVGYGKPPTDKQFQKGRSGNPKGRPPGARNLASYARQELAESIDMTINGQTRRVAKGAVIVKTHVAKAAKGDARSAEYISKLEQRGEAFASFQETRGQPLSEDDALILDRYFAALQACRGASDVSE